MTATTTNNQGFVYVTQQPIEESDLKQLLEQDWQTPTYYFLRWPHEVSGIVDELEEGLSPEGQKFSKQQELRWKQRGKGYEVLLLTTRQLDTLPEAFKQLGKWRYLDRNAKFYKRRETRLPKTLNYPDQLNIKQRYFMDANTEIVHFVALTVEPSKP